MNFSHVFTNIDLYLTFQTNRYLSFLVFMNVKKMKRKRKENESADQQERI